MWGLPSSGKTSMLIALTKLIQPDTITFRYQDDLVPTKTFNMQDFYHTTDSTYRIILYDVGGASGNNHEFFIPEMTHIAQYINAGPGYAGL